MMKRTKASFLGRKYMSILRASIVVEAVAYIVTLTDTLVAGNMIGTAALTAVGLVAPLVGVSSFLMSVINSGTVPKYSYHIGRFDRKRANEYFSQGVLLGLSLGVVFLSLFLVLKDAIIERHGVSAEMLPYVRDYYGVIVFCFLLDPVMALLDNTVVADGGENLSAFANVFQIISNIALSIWFSRLWGVKGIAYASLLGKVLFLAIISAWFFGKKNTVRFVKHWSMRDCADIIRSGIVRASYYILTGLMAATLNAFVIARLDPSVLPLMIVAERYLDITSVFAGLSAAVQPLIGTLRGENNTKAMRSLMKMVTRVMVYAGLIVTALTLASARLLAGAFGIDGSLTPACAAAFRIICTTMAVQSILCLFFNYYFLLEKRMLALLIGALKDYLAPVVLACAAAALLHAANGLWIGLALAPVLSALIASAVVLKRHGKKEFPFLIPSEGEDRIFIYDTEVNESSAAVLSKTANRLLRENGVSPRTQTMIGILVDDLVMMIYEKNLSARKPVAAELTIMLEDTGTRVILRDSGVLFDITDQDMPVGNYRQYIIARVMEVPERKVNIATTGYNRNEFFFEDRSPETE